MIDFDQTAWAEWLRTEQGETCLDLHQATDEYTLAEAWLAVMRMSFAAGFMAGRREIKESGN